MPTDKDPVADARAVKLTEKLRCLVCQNQTIADSNAELAQDLRRQVREQIAAGKTDDEIVDYMVARYGDFVLYQPPVKATTVLLWAGPALLLLVGFVGLVRIVRARRAEPDAAPLTRGGARARRAAVGRRRRQGHFVIPFILVAVAMVAIAVAWVLVPLLRRGKPEGVVREASNVAILRDQLGELDADLAAGTMPREQYEEARRELEQRVLEDSKAVAAAAAAPTQSAAWTAAILGGAIPIVALLLYVALGNLDAFAPGRRATSQRMAPSTRSPGRRSRRWRRSSLPSSRRNRTMPKGG